MPEILHRWVANDTIFYTILILFVAVISFSLGRLSVLAEAQAGANSADPVIITQPVGAVTVPANPQTAEYVASKKGTKYHALTCPGAKQISEANKIYFQTAALAQAAGYSLAGNCVE